MGPPAKSPDYQKSNLKARYIDFTHLLIIVRSFRAYAHPETQLGWRNVLRSEVIDASCYYALIEHSFEVPATTIIIGFFGSEMTVYKSYSV